MRLTAVSTRMNTSHFPLLIIVFYVFTGVVGVVSEYQRFIEISDLTSMDDQRTRSKSMPTPKVSPTPLPNDWHGLVPLQSTRSDVERILGKPRKSRYSTYIYDTAHDRIDVLYSEGPCQVSEVERWKVAKDTIIRLDIRPKHTVPVKLLVLNRNKYIRTRESHPNNWFTYLNKEDGIRVETIQSGQVEEVNSITYGPKAKDQSLHCPRE